MIMRAGRHILVLALIIGIVAPMSSAALARLGVIDARVMVICTGDAMRTIVIGPDGQPVELSGEPEPCALVHAAFAAVPDRATVPALRRLAGLEPREVQSLATPRKPHLLSLPRAPPVV